MIVETFLATVAIVALMPEEKGKEDFFTDQHIEYIQKTDGVEEDYILEGVLIKANIARRTDIPGSILNGFARDRSVTVRRILSANPKTSRETLVILAGDSDHIVRKKALERLRQMDN